MRRDLPPGPAGVGRTAPPARSRKAHLQRMGQTLLTFAALSWIAFFLKQTQGVFVPFVAAFVLSLASAPVVEGLRRRGVPYWLAVLGIVLFGLLALAGVGILLEETIGAFVEHAP